MEIGRIPPISRCCTGIARGSSATPLRIKPGGRDRRGNPRTIARRARDERGRRAERCAGGLTAVPRAPRSCRESNPPLYQGKYRLNCRFVTPRCGSVPLVTCGFVSRVLTASRVALRELSMSAPTRRAPIHHCFGIPLIDRLWAQTLESRRRPYLPSRP
jgi:hypothetical protein